MTKPPPPHSEKRKEDDARAMGETGLRAAYHSGNQRNQSGPSGRPSSAVAPSPQGEAGPRYKNLAMPGRIPTPDFSKPSPSSDVAGLVRRIMCLAKRRDLEGIYTDGNLCEEAAATLESQADYIHSLSRKLDATQEQVAILTERLRNRDSDVAELTSGRWHCVKDVEQIGTLTDQNETLLTRLADLTDKLERVEAQLADAKGAFTMLAAEDDTPDGYYQRAHDIAKDMLRALGETDAI